MVVRIYLGLHLEYYFCLNSLKIIVVSYELKKKRLYLLLLKKLKSVSSLMRLQIKLGISNNVCLCVCESIAIM